MILAYRPIASIFVAVDSDRAKISFFFQEKRKLVVNDFVLFVRVSLSLAHEASITPVLVVVDSLRQEGSGAK